MTKKQSLITLGVSLSLTFIALFTSLIVFIVTTTTYQTQLENVYQRSLYELSSNINDIEVDISKLIATTQPEIQKELLTNLFNTCTIAGINISNVPVANENINDVTEFINKLNGFSYSLIAKIDAETDWSETDIESIEELHAHSLTLMYDFNSYLANLDYNFSILSGMNFKDASSGINADFQNMQTTSSQVPTLIYDGPFADSVLNPEILGLPDQEVDLATAQATIEQELGLLYDINSVEYVNDTNGMFETYNFNVKCQGVTLFVQVTKMGGQILEITSVGDGGDKDYTDQESLDLATTFARALGFNDMYPIWNTTNEDIMYINLAPVNNLTIYYPDLIKVKVDKKLGLVTGWEARNYFYNHTERTLPTPTITIEQGQELVSPALTVNERNYAVIPLDYGQEVYAYEYICTWHDYEYYVYIDATTGQEVNILRLIKTTTGDLVM